MAWTILLGAAEIPAAQARQNKPPQAKLKVSERDKVNHVVEADASESTDTDGSIVQYVFWVTDQERGGLVSRVVESVQSRQSFTLLPGKYMVNVTVVDNQGAMSAAAKSVQIGGQGAVAAADRIPPMGVPIHTNLGDGLGVQLGANFVPPVGPPGAGGVQVVVLDRGTATVVTSDFFPAAGSTSWTRFSTMVATAQPTQLVILSGIGAPATYSAAAFTAIKSAIDRLGGNTSGLSATSPALRTGLWSLIGFSGLAAGTARQHFSSVPLDAGPTSGDVAGYLQLDTHGNYAFVYGDYVRFTTSVAGKAAGTNVMQIGTATYTSLPLAPNASGFHVVVVEPTSLALQHNATFVTRTPAGPDDAGIEALGAMLGQVRAGPGPVIVIAQSIGTAAVSPAWAGKAAPELHELGGNLAVLNGLNGTGGYALIGGTGADRPVLETSAALTGAPGQLHGMLERNSDSHYVVASWAVAEEYITDLMPLAFQAPQPWPYASTAGEVAANVYIATQLGLGTSNVRDAYWQAPNLDWAGAEVIKLKAITYPGSKQGFSRQEFTALQSQLLKEFAMVTNVRALITAWQGVFEGRSSLEFLDLRAIADQIERALHPPSHGGINVDPLAVIGIFQGILSIAGGGLNKVSAGATGALGGASSLAGALASLINSRGDDVPVSQRIQTTVDQLGDELAHRYVEIQSAFDHIGDVLVSDYGKLSTVDARAPKEWAFDTQARDLALVHLENAARQLAYSALMPLAYPYVYELRASEINPSLSSASAYRCAQQFPNFDDGRPFAHTPGTATFQAIVGVDHDGKYERNIYVLSGVPVDAWIFGEHEIITGIESGYSTDEPPFIGSSRWVPPASLLDPLFLPVQAGGTVGLYRQYFFDHFKLLPMACTVRGF
jgi:hypothetical protein